MRFAQIVTPGGPRPALAAEDGYVRRDEAFTDAPTSLEGLIADHDGWIPRLAEAADGQLVRREPAAEMAPPLSGRAVIAIGLNYHDHCREFGTPPPEKPIVFVKLPTSIVGPTADIAWDPRVTAEVDWEAELAVIIGREARNVSVDEAEAVIFGHTVLNDVTARDVQRSEQQWVRAKSLDTFCPIGPVVVTRDEVDVAQGLRIRSWVNGTPMQDSSTAEMIFDVRELVAYLSTAFTLRPGDVIATGTPLGVGAFRSPPVFLGDGDVVEVEVEGIGRLRNTCRLISSEES